MNVLFMTSKLRRVLRPQGFLAIFGNEQLLLKGDTIAGILEYFEASKTALDDSVAVEPLMMDRTQRPVAAIYFGDNEGLMTLAHRESG